MVASRKLVEIANLFPVCKFKDKIFLKLKKYIFFDYQTYSCKSSSEGTKETELLDFQ